jgi:hypothetical protein
MPIASAGKKDPALAAAIKAGRIPDVSPAFDYVVGRKPLRVGSETRRPGDPVPEAATWPRLESWVRSGAIIAKPAGSVTPPAAPERPVEPVSEPVAAEVPETPEEPKGRGLRRRGGSA